MKGFTFDLQRFTTWLVTQNTDGSLALTDESNEENTKTLNLSGTTQIYNLNDFAGDTLKLNGDITVKRTATLSGATVTLDLNGHTWQQNEVDPFTAEKTYPNGQTVSVSYRPATLFQISTGGNLIIDDSSAGKTGALVINEDVAANDSAKVLVILTGGAAVLNNGSLINNGKNVEGNTNGIFAVQLNNASNASFTMNGGSISVPNEASDTGKAIRCLGVVDSTTVTITDGTITSAGYGIDINANLIVNGGTIETTGDKAAINVFSSTAESTATITGGTIKSATGAAINFDAPNGTLTISGGTFTGDITADESATINADEYSVTRTVLVTVDGVATQYTTDQWANVKDTLKEISLNSKTSSVKTVYYTDAGWEAAESTLVKATFDGETFYFTSTSNMSTAAGNGGYTNHHYTVDGDPNTYFSTDGWAAVKDTLTKITLDGATVYYTADKWATVEGTLYKAYLNDATKYYTTEAKRTSAIKNYKFTAVIDGETRNYNSEAKKQATLDKCTTVKIDGETKYFTDATAAVANCVAKIGDDNYYTTLQAAVNAVQDNGTTITLLDDAMGSGVKVTSGKNFTLDFNKHTYTVVDTPVGSTGTETIGFQLLQNSTITFKDGKIAAGAYGTNNKLLRLIQNYANLTLDNMDIDGSGLLINSAGQMLRNTNADDTLTTVSTNNGTLNLTGTTSIEAIETRYYTKDDGTVVTTSGTALAVGYAAQSYPNGAQVNVNTTGAIDGISFGTWGEGGNTFTSGLTVTNGTIKGDITISDDASTLGAANKITINGGKFTVANETLGITAEVVDTEDGYFTTETLAKALDGFVPATIDGTTKYFATQALADAAVADCAASVMLDGETTYFSTLAKAANSVDGKTATINLLKDETGAGIMFSNAATNVTIDFGKHKYTVGNPAVGSAGTESQAFHFDKGAIVTLKDGTITSSAETSSVAMLVQNYANLTVEDMTLDGSNLADAIYWGELGACITLSLNNGTVNITGNTNIIARKDANADHYAMDVCASGSYPDGAHVTVDTTGTIDDVLIDGKKTGSDGKFVSELTITNGTVGEIRVDSDAVGVNAQDKIKITGGTLTNGNLVGASEYLILKSASPWEESFADDYILAVKGWNSVSDKFFYVQAPAEGNLGTKLITVSGIDSADQLKLDETNKIFAVPTTATATVNDNDYKFVQVTYDGTTATVKTTDDDIKITENLLAETVTKISASGNANPVYISGGDEVTSIVGGSKNDTLGGTNAILTLKGGEGADIFVADNDKITIEDYGTGNDKISVGADAGTPNVAVSGKNNLVLTFGDTTVNLLGAATKVVTVTNGEGDLYYSKEGQTSSDGDSVTLPASTKTYTVKDPIKNVDGSNTAGVAITGNALDNSLTGSADNDKLLGNAGNDTLNGGTGGNDVLAGGKGDDVFVYSAGKTVITDYSPSGTNGADKISVGAAPSSFKFSGANLVLTFDDDKTLTVNGAKNKAITFIDGENETVRTYSDNGAINEDGKVTLDEDFKGAGQNISKVKDVTQIDASASTCNLNLVGNNLGNTIKGGSGNDILTGGVTAADEYTGNAGADTFVYNGGKDIITDYKSTDKDVVNLAKNFAVKSVDFSDSDVVFTFNASGNTLTLNNAANDTITVRDAAKRIWTYTDEYTAQGAGVTLQSTAKEFDASTNDWKTAVTLNASAATEGVKLTGNAKNNVFVGSNGADTFVHTAGNDVITNYDTNDTVKVDNFSSITAAKFGSKTIVTYGKNTLTFNNNQTSINLVDEEKNTATLTKDGVVTDNSIQLFNGTKTYSGTLENVDATNVRNAVILAGGKAAQTFTGAKGRTVYTYDGTKTMTIENYAAGDKISVKGSVTNFTVDNESGDVTLTITNGENTGSIVLKDSANQLITLHDNSNGNGKYTARAYLATGITADRLAPTAVTLSSSVTEYEAPKTVKQITYTGGTVNVTNFNTAAGRINHGKLAITDVSENSLAFSTGNTLTFAEHDAATRVLLTGTNTAGKAVNSTVWLGDHALYNNIAANASAVSVTGGENFTAGNKVKTVTALGSDKLSIAGNNANNVLTANNAGDTLNGVAGTDVLIGGSGNDVFIHDKITGATTINGFTTSDAVDLGDKLTVVGSAYAPGAKNGTLTLVVEGTNDAGKSSTSKIVINSTDFTKAKGTTYGTITIDGEETSFGKNAIYSDGKVKLLSTFSGKFAATLSSEVDGSDAVKALTLQGTTGDETLTGGKGNDVLTGGKSSDSLTGGDGKDIFVYSYGDGDDVIADFTYNADRLKVATKNIIKDISVDKENNLTFTMTDGGSVTIEDIAKDDFFIKANGMLYWFDDSENLVTASDKTTKAAIAAIIKRPTDYAIVELDYGTNLVSAKLATASDQSTAFNADKFKTTT